ncbi:polyprenol phosphomannose-dependent alpha 1,6 mannosyltransferase MptB [Streptomyces sp. MUM 178J]|uniref:polyprenol phosphomannose-dependent alpha 1,6 mannosyltransferase MptB n=1 Tax=Streptomyces sp. MUM 178J TaxID=2791991 RepID=UPI003FA7E236
MLAIRLPVVDTRRCQLLGLAGSTALAAGGATAGALPVREALAPGSGRASFGLVGVYFGLVLLIAGWALLGRAVRGPEPPVRRTLMLTLCLWAAPLVLAPPLFSRDVYSYLAQGAMVEARMDVYAYGPSHLGGPLPAEVAPLWQHTPAPYGPVFLALASAIADVSRAEVTSGVFGMRIVALLGVALMALCLPALARHCGADPAAALWLGALNPLVLLHLVGGAHNDAVMLGLLGAGLVAALGRWPVLGAVLVTLAALVKAPAALGLAAVAVLWTRRRFGRKGAQAQAVLGVLAVSAATTVVTTALTGTGYGWISALDTPVSPENWSLTSSLGRMTHRLLEGAGSGLAPLAAPAWHLTGLAATALAILLVWRRHRLRRPLYALGLSLIAVALLGPAIRPWYVLWGMFLIAAAGPDRSVRRAVAAGSSALALAVLPSGFAPDGRQLALATAGGLLAVLTLWCACLAARRGRTASAVAGSTI